MKIAELSRRSGVSVPSIKFYLREGLLAPGARRAPNQAEYDEEHLRRLELICVLRDVGGVGIAAIRRVVQALDDSRNSLYDLMGAAVDALGGHTAPTGALATDPEASSRAAAEVDALVAEMGWSIRQEAGARADLVEALVEIRRHFIPNMPATALVGYARAADSLARADLCEIPEQYLSRPERTLETVVLGTILFEPALLALRRLAHEHYARTLLPGGAALRPLGPVPTGEEE